MTYQMKRPTGDTSISDARIVGEPLDFSLGRKIHQFYLRTGHVSYKALMQGYNALSKTVNAPVLVTLGGGVTAFLEAPSSLNLAWQLGAAVTTGFICRTSYFLGRAKYAEMGFQIGLKRAQHEVLGGLAEGKFPAGQADAQAIFDRHTRRMVRICGIAGGLALSAATYFPAQGLTTTIARMGQYVFQKENTLTRPAPLQAAPSSAPVMK